MKAHSPQIFLQHRDKKKTRIRQGRLDRKDEKEGTQDNMK